MPATDFIPRRDSQFVAFLQTYVEACNANQEELGLTKEEVAKLTELAENFYTTYSASFEQLTAYRSAVVAKDTAKSEATQWVRTLARKMKGQPNASPALLVGTGAVVDTSSGPVRWVTGLITLPEVNGITKLQWDRNGNAPRTLFIVEFRKSGEAEWSFAGATTKSKFEHVGQIVGEETWYRVSALRAGQSSVACPAVAAYPRDSESVNLRIA